MSKNYVILSDNKKVLFRELVIKTPSLIHGSDLFDEICYYIVEKYIQTQSNIEFQLYVNLLLLKSVKTRQLVSLIFLINNRMISVKEIQCDFVGKDLFEYFLRHEHTIKFNQISKKFNYIEFRYKYFVFPVKILLHKLYRFLKKNICYKDAIIKTYVEDTLGFYPNEMKRSTIFIYPFNLNINRQKKFIEYCKKEHKNDYSLMGVPYSLTGYFFNLLKSKNTDNAIIRSEYNAFLKHSQELQCRGVKEVFALDEFEVASLVMHSNLVENGVYVKNKTHGVGGYCLFLGYKDLEVYTSRQYERYRKWNPAINITYQKVVDGINTVFDENESIKVVFMTGNMEACGLFYEEELETQIIKKLSEVCEKLNLDFYIKFHPNTKDEAKLKYNHLNELEKVDNGFINPLFVTIFSTSFYDFLKFGPFIFLSDEFLDPTIVFASDIEYDHYKNTHEVIKRHTLYSNYVELHQQQVSKLVNR